jgi:hypothetical protein
MKNVIRLLIVVQLLIIFVPFAVAKTHKDTYPVSCETLWRSVKDTVRNSGKYGIIAIDNVEMTASFNIGGNLTGKRTNSVVLNKQGDNSCEMQVQTAFSGLVNNDYGDFKKRVDESMARLAKEPPREETAKPAAAAVAPELVPAKNVKFPEGLKPGQSPDEVKQVLGKPQDSLDMKDSLIYIYPGYKLIFEKGQLADVRYPEANK